MAYQNIISLLDNTPNQPTKLKRKNWVEINYESRRTYNQDTQIRFKTSMSRSRLCDYNDAYILVKGIVTIANSARTATVANNANKKVIFKTCAPFTSSISRINNTQIDDIQYIDIVMLVYNSIEQATMAQKLLK